MITIDELKLKYVNKEHEPRKIGRYWSSEVNSIAGGWTKPKDFFKQREIDLKGAGMIIVGQAMEEKLALIFENGGVDFEYDDGNNPKVKKEIQITDEIVLVVKTDFIIANQMVIETKFPFSAVGNVIPQRYLRQLECEYRAFYLPVCLGVLSVPFNLRLLEYIPSKTRWQSIQKLLISYHEQVKAIARQMRLE